MQFPPMCCSKVTPPAAPFDAPGRGPTIRFSSLLIFLQIRRALSPVRGLRSTSLGHDDDGVDIGPSSRLGSGYCIDDCARFLNQPPEHGVRSFSKAHDNPAAEENPLSRVAQDRRA